MADWASERTDPVTTVDSLALDPFLPPPVVGEDEINEVLRFHKLTGPYWTAYTLAKRKQVKQGRAHRKTLFATVKLRPKAPATRLS